MKIIHIILAASALAFVAAITLGFANAGPGRCHNHTGYTHCH